MKALIIQTRTGLRYSLITVTLLTITNYNQTTDYLLDYSTSPKARAINSPASPVRLAS